MGFSKLLTIVLFLAFMVACGGDDAVPDPIPTATNIYENCCGMAPLEMDFNPGKVYLPNIFTPKKLDGFNDVFYVFADDDIETVEIFRIIDSSGFIVYEFLDFLPNNPVYGWLPDETVENGYYQFFVKVKNINGDEFDMNGGVCVYACDASNPFDYSEDCGSPSQENGDGRFDPFLPDFEEDCP